jgi:tetratricopeptide (TPR) repeat protein
MRVLRLALWCAIMFLLTTSLCAAAADSGTISGVVRDEQGKALSGVTVKLNGKVSTMSGPSGDYRFSNLALGAYKIAALLDGCTMASSPVVSVTSASIAVTADLTLMRTSSTSAQKTPQFQAAGIHGLIDPGGYSASAGADAASGVLRGIADVQRTGMNVGTSSGKDWPCALEPGLQRAVEANPDQAEPNRRLGEFYVAHAQPSMAIPLLKRALQIDRTDYTASRELSVAWLQSGQFEEARKLLRLLAEKHNEPEVHQLLARADEGSGMFPQAAQEYRIADKEQPSEESLFGVGYEFLLSGAPANAVEVFEAGEKQYPRSIALRIGAGTAQFLLGHSAGAVHAFLEATDMEPTDPRPYPFLAAASGISGEENERVRDSFRRYLDHAPQSAAATYLYALVLSRDSANTDMNRIEALLNRAIQLDPGLAKAHLLLADIYGRRNDYSDAVPEYEAAVRLSPDLTEAHYRLAMMLRRAGRTKQSEQEMLIFQQARAKQAAGQGSNEINIAQFISVMDTPTKRPSAEVQCEPIR